MPDSRTDVIDDEDLGLDRLSGASGSEGDTDRARDEDAIDEEMEGGRDAGEVCPCGGGGGVGCCRLSESMRCN